VDDSFFRVLFPGRHRVLGRELPPFSFWHQACLYALSSPFVQASGNITLADVQIAVKVCHTRYPHSPDLRPTFADAWQRWRFDRRPDVVRGEAQAFAAYRAAFTARPRFWENEGELPRTYSAPAILAHVAQLERLTKFTHDQAWNDVPPGYADWLVSTIIEQLGGESRFLYEDDEQPETDLPDLNALEDDALFKIVERDRGTEFAQAWLDHRRRSQTEEAM